MVPAIVPRTINYVEGFTAESKEFLILLYQSLLPLKNEEALRLVCLKKHGGGAEITHYLYFRKRKSGPHDLLECQN